MVFCRRRQCHSPIMRTLLEGTRFPGRHDSFLLVRSLGGRPCRGRGQDIVVEDVATTGLSKIDIAVLSAGACLARGTPPGFAAAGAVVVGCSLRVAQDPEVPLVVSRSTPTTTAAPRASSRTNCAHDHGRHARPQPLVEAGGISTSSCPPTRRLRVGRAGVSPKLTSQIGRRQSRNLRASPSTAAPLPCPEPGVYVAPIAFDVVPARHPHRRRWPKRPTEQKLQQVARPCRHLRARPPARAAPDHLRRVRRRLTDQARALLADAPACWRRRRPRPLGPPTRQGPRGPASPGSRRSTVAQPHPGRLRRQPAQGRCPQRGPGRRGRGPATALNVASRPCQYELVA